MSNNTNFIGKYRIVEELASGAFGRVYRGEDTSMNNRIVAIKLMHSTHLSSSQEHHSFLQEAQFLKLLKHPFILPVLEVGIDKDFPYMVTEYAPNGSLLDRLTKQAPRMLPMQETLLILAQIGQALQYAHQQNIIHRDLKPANILFNANGDAVLADFGIATMLATSIKYGTAIGTPYYMAPEQFRGSISKEGDQYALGCIAYELFTGRVPFTAPDFFALGYKHMSETPLAPTQLNLLLSRSIDQAVLKAMAKQRGDRYADITAFLAALGAPSAITPPAGGSPRAHTRTPARAPALPPFHPRPYATLYAGSISGNVKEGLEGDEDVTIMKNFRPGRQVFPGSEEAMHLVPPPPNRQIDREETGKHPLIGGPLTIDREETGKHPLIGGPLTIDREETGKVFSPADSLPRVLESPLPAGPSSLTPHNMVGGSARSVVDDVIAADQRFSSGYNAGYRVQADKSAMGAMNRPIRGGAAASVQADSDRPSLFPVGADGQFAGRKRGGQWSRWLMAAAIALVLLLIGSGVLYAMATMFSNKTTSHTTKQAPVVATIPTATVSIAPTRTNLNGTYKISAVTGKPNASQQQVGAHILSSISPSQSSTVQATGQGTIPAVQARGTLTYWNDSSYAIPFSAGLVYTDSNGIQIMNDAGGTVPPGSPNGPTWMAVTVPAHAIQAGTVGNVQSGDINIWTSYQDGTFVVQNDSVFNGGQNAQHYSYVQGSDYNGAVKAANQLQVTETSAAQEAINRQVPANEVMLGSVQCTPHIAYNHGVGDHATSITSNVSVSCTAEVYDQQAALAMASGLLTQKIASTPNASYALANKVSTKILQAKVVDGRGTIALLVSAEGVGVFQFSDAQKLELTLLIAGKSEQVAQSILSNQPGISVATINISGGDGHTMPKDASRITIVVMQ